MSYNRPELREKIEKWFELHADEMIKDLGRIISVKSVKSQAAAGAPYGKGSRASIDLARAMLERRGYAVSMYKDMIISADIGPGFPKMGILAHLDVVPEGEGWDSDPFEMVIKNGRIYGRGATDNKGPSVAAMYAMYCANDLCPELRHGFRLLLGSGEECGCEDITQYLAENKPPAHVFTPDAEYPIVNVEKGRLAPFFEAYWERDTSLPRIVSLIGGKTLNVVPNRAEAVIEGFSLDDVLGFCSDFSAATGASISAVDDGGRLLVVSEGVATHAAMPQHGVNAQTALIKMLSSMPFASSKGFEYIRALNRLFPHGDYLGKAFGIAMSDQIAGELTLSFGVIRFSEYELSGNFDSRTPACADDVDLPGMTRSAFEREGFLVKSLSTTKAHHTPEGDPFVQTLLGIYEHYTGRPRNCLAVGGQTYVHSIPGGVAFGCAMPGAGNNIHGANEFISIEDLLVSAKMFAHAILETCG